MLRCMRIMVTMTGMAMVFRCPEPAVRLEVALQLASWDKAGTASQLRLAGFLAHVAEVVDPEMATASRRVAVKLTVGLPGHQRSIGSRSGLSFPLTSMLGIYLSTRIPYVWSQGISVMGSAGTGMRACCA
jgi:hypothetical protein